MCLGREFGMESNSIWKVDRVERQEQLVWAAQEDWVELLEAEVLQDRVEAVAMAVVVNPILISRMRLRFLMVAMAPMVKMARPAMMGYLAGPGMLESTDNPGSQVLQGFPDVLCGSDRIAETFTNQSPSQLLSPCHESVRDVKWILDCSIPHK